MNKSQSVPRQNALVKFNFAALPKEYWAQYPFVENAVYVYLGEIPNMPGHCVVGEHPCGKIFSGYHTENFKELEEDEFLTCCTII